MDTESLNEEITEEHPEYIDENPVDAEEEESSGRRMGDAEKFNYYHKRTSVVDWGQCRK